MTIQEKIAAYAAKLEKKEQDKKTAAAAVIDAANAFITAYNACHVASVKRELTTVYGRLTAFVNGEKYAPTGKGVKTV